MLQRNVHQGAGGPFERRSGCPPPQHGTHTARPCCSTGVACVGYAAQRSAAEVTSQSGASARGKVTCCDGGWHPIHPCPPFPEEVHNWRICSAAAVRRVSVTPRPTGSDLQVPSPAISVRRAPHQPTSGPSPCGAHCRRKVACARGAGQCSGRLRCCSECLASPVSPHSRSYCLAASHWRRPPYPAFMELTIAGLTHAVDAGGRHTACRLPSPSPQRPFAPRHPRTRRSLHFPPTHLDPCPATLPLWRAAPHR